ncbi:MAG: twin-arginine translocation signal domain-containing protein [Acidobacteriota bacterium]|nr:twin-arginine translocation signal domain-containing protein [Acidobacteriota bacterium]
MSTFKQMHRRNFLRASAALGAGSLLTASLPCAGAESSDAAPASAIVRTPALSPASSVKVKDIRTYKLKEAIFVEVVASNGVSGWGESSPNNRHVVETFIHTGLKEHVVGRGIWDAEPVWDAMFFANHDLGPSGILPYSIAGIDLALWDLRGRLTGLPVYKLLGGEYRKKIRAYGSFGVNGGRRMTPDGAARQAVKFVERGFKAVKLRMQIRERQVDPVPDPTMDYARAVRRAIGRNIDFWVDINNGYTASRAIEMGKRLREELNIIYYEEPVSTQNLHELAQVVEALDFPVIAGEKEYTRWQHRDLIEQGKVGMLNPDVSKCGGLTEAKKIAALAQACSKQIIVHNTKPTFSTAASLHFIASIPNAAPYMEFIDVDEFKDLLDVMKNHVEFRDGYLHVPERPGLGLEVDEAAVKRAVVT